MRAAGYEVLAIDPQAEGDDVRRVALVDLDEPAASFAAAVAARSRCTTSIRWRIPAGGSASWSSNLVGRW